MSVTTRIGTALAAGYVLGRYRKLRLALIIGSALANKNVRTSGIGLLRQGADRLASSPQGKELGKQITGQLVEAGKAAGVTMAASGVDRLSDRLHDRSEQLRSTGQPADEQDEERDEAPPDDRDEEPDEQDEGEQPEDRAGDEPDDDRGDEPEDRDDLDDLDEDGDEDEDEPPADEEEDQQPADEYDDEGEPADEDTNDEPAPRRRRAAAPSRGGR